MGHHDILNTTAGDQPFVVSTVMKSGTWMFREIVERLTGLTGYEPPPVAGVPDYGSADALTIPQDRFFCWHLYFSPPVCDEIRSRRAKVIFLVRNIYDLTLSVFHHLYSDIDREIGKDAGIGTFLSEFSKEEALSLTITGFREGRYGWLGLAHILSHIEGGLRFAQSYPVLVVSYERMQRDKMHEIRRIAAYLGIDAEEHELQKIIDETSFDTMRAKSRFDDKPSSHFRQGRIGGYEAELSHNHRMMIRSLLETCTPDLPRLVDKLALYEITDDKCASTQDRLLHHVYIDRASGNRASGARLIFQDAWAGLLRESIPIMSEKLGEVFAQRLNESTGCGGGRVVLYGLNDLVDGIMEELRNCGYEVAAIADGSKWENVIQHNGIPVVRPNDIPKDIHAVVVTALQWRWRKEIGELLSNIGVNVPVLDFGIWEVIEYKGQYLAAMRREMDRLIHLVKSTKTPIVLIVEQEGAQANVHGAASTELGKRGWNCIRVSLADDGVIERSGAAECFSISKGVFLERLSELSGIVIHTVSCPPRLDIPMLINVARSPDTRYIVELVQVPSLLRNAEDDEEWYAKLERMWGSDARRIYLRQMGCEKYLTENADGVVRSGDADELVAVYDLLGATHAERYRQ